MAGALHAVHVQIDCINVSLDYVAGPAVFQLIVVVRVAKQLLALV